MKSYIIGTAGHVDHGKTQLIKALTGVDTDRLKEEKERGISIELGFAALSLPGGTNAGVVDVPGHEKFVRQMLAGIGGIDLVLLVIAADEGVMPQTREHLEIIDLLKINRGLVVLTKVDLVESDWCELIKLEIAETLKDTILDKAEIVEVSAVTGQGIDYLRARIDEELKNMPSRQDRGPCRLPIDRSFSIPGFGTVVTGTIYQGEIKLGDPVTIEPGNIESRVRTLQVHGIKVEEAYGGQRVAVNLPNVELTDIPRGATLLTPGYLRTAQILDLSLEYLNSAESPLEHRQRVRFHIGTKEVLGRIHLLDREELTPGGKAYVQILLEEPVVAARKDRFIIRHYSPVHTIAGGIIIDTGNKKYKRFEPGCIERMSIKEKGTPGELVQEYLIKKGIPCTLADLGQGTGLDLADVQTGLNELEENVGKVIIDSRPNWFSKQSVAPLLQELQKYIKQYHTKYTLRPGLIKEEAKSRLFVNWTNKMFAAMITYFAEIGSIEIVGNYLRLPGFIPEPKGILAQQSAQLIKEFQTSELSPPEWQGMVAKYRIDQSMGEELLQHFLRTGDLVKVANNLYFSAEAIEKAKSIILQLLEEKAEFSASEAKEHLNTSRKYLIPLLEYLDIQKVTRRIGEKRVKF